MSEHWVRLPHPAKDGTTVGSCRCGWTVTYSWGGHGDAAQTAAEHIEQATESEPVELADLTGQRTVIPGRSL